MKSFSTKDALVVGWQTFKERPFFLIGLFILTTFISVMTGVVSDMVTHGATGLILNVLDFSVQIILGMGLLLILIRVYDKVDTDYKDLFEPIHLFWKYFFMTIFVVLIVSIGLVLFIIPGIIAGIALTFAPYLVVDKNMNAVEAIKESVRITHGHRWNLLFFAFVLVLVNVLGAAALGIGLFITIPITAIAAVHVYRWLLNPPAHAGLKVSVWTKVFMIVVMVCIFIGLFYSIATVSSINQIRPNSLLVRDTQRKADLLETKLSLDIFYDATGVYPTSLTELVPQYIQSLPVDPATHSEYIYTNSIKGDNYSLCTILESGTKDTYCVENEKLGPGK